MWTSFSLGIVLSCWILATYYPKYGLDLICKLCRLVIFHDVHWHLELGVVQPRVLFVWEAGCTIRPCHVPELTLIGRSTIVGNTSPTDGNLVHVYFLCFTCPNIMSHSKSWPFGPKLYRVFQVKVHYHDFPYLWLWMIIHLIEILGSLDATL